MRKNKKTEDRPARKLVGCPDCLGGFREVSAIVQVGDALQLIGPMAAFCDCSGGGWREWLDKYPNAIRAFWTTRDQRKLPPDGLYQPGSPALGRALQAADKVAEERRHAWA